MIARYLTVDSVDEALHVLKRHSNTQTVAGGTESFPRASKGQKEYICVDVGRVRALRQVEADEEGIRIGAAVRIAELADASPPELADDCRALLDAARSFASPQVRNQATVVGNLCTGRAIAAFAVAARALGGALLLKGDGGPVTCELTPESVQSAVAGRRLATSLIIPRGKGLRGSAYLSVGRRAAFSFPAVVAAASLEVRDGSIAAARSVVAPVFTRSEKTSAPAPCAGCGGPCRLCTSVRLEELDASLDGAPATREAIELAVDDYAWEAVRVRDSAVSGPGAYRRRAMKELVKRSLIRSLEQARRIGDGDID